MVPTPEAPGPASTDGEGVCVVIATYNEAENLPSVVRQLRGVLPRARVIVVDDASPDGTGDIAEALRDEIGGMTVLRRAGKLGYASAHADGQALALSMAAQWAVSMDADLSHRPADLPVGLALMGDADLAIGSRYVTGGRTEGWPLHRQVLSAWGNAVFRRALGVRVRDMSSGFRIYGRRALQAANFGRLASRGYAVLIESLLRCHDAGLVIAEFPIVFREREHGRSKMSWRIVREQLALLLRMVWRRRVLRRRGMG